MSDLTERLRRRAETLDVLSDPDLPPATIGTLAWKIEVRLSMRSAAKDSTEAADAIDRLTRELAEAQKDRDYWKVEAEGERAKVAFRDKMTGDPDAIADRVVNAIHAEFNINLIGKADNHRLRSAVARAMNEKP